MARVYQDRSSSPASASSSPRVELEDERVQHGTSALSHQGGQIPVGSRDEPGTFERVKSFADGVKTAAKRAEDALPLAADAGLMDAETAEEYSITAGVIGEDAGLLSAGADLASGRDPSLLGTAKKGAKLASAYERATDEESMEVHARLYDQMEDQAEDLAETVAEVTAPAAEAGAEVLDSMASTFSYWGGDAVLNSSWVQAMGESLSDTARAASTYGGELASQAGTMAMETGQQLAENAQPLIDAAAPIIELGGDAADALGLDVVGAAEALGHAAAASGNAGCYAIYRQTLFSAKQSAPQDADLHAAIDELLDRTEILESLGKGGTAVATGVAKSSGVPGAGLAMKAATAPTEDSAAAEAKRMPSGVMKTAMLTWTNADAAATVYRVAEAMDSAGTLHIMGELESAHGALEGERKAQFEAALEHASAYGM